MAMVPMIAQLNGASKATAIPFQFQQGLYMALLLSVPIGLILYKAGFIINLMDVEAALTEKNHWLLACGDLGGACLLGVPIHS